MQWTLEQLRQFALAAELGSFSAAARRLGKAQSAVSTAVALLEADLGIALFDRAGRNAALTPEGEVMLREARELLRQADAFDRRALAFSAGQQARLVIALDEALPYLVIGKLLVDTARRYPALELTQLNGTAAEVADFVRDGCAQAGFHFDHGDPGPDYAHSYLGSVAQGVYAGRRHPLARQRGVSRHDLARHRQLVMQMQGAAYPELSPSVWRSDSIYGIAAMAADGLGWAVLPVNIAEYESFRVQLRQLDCEGLAPAALGVRMIWKPGAGPGEAERWMRARMERLLAGK